MDRSNELRDQILFYVQKCSELEKIIEDLRETIEYLRRSRATAMEVIDTFRSTLDDRQRRVQEYRSVIDSERRRHEINMDEMSEIIKRHEAIIHQQTETMNNQSLATNSTIDQMTSRGLRLQQSHEEQMNRQQQGHEEQMNFHTLATLARNRRQMTIRRMTIRRRQRDATTVDRLRANVRRARVGNGKLFKAAARRHRNVVALAAEALTEVEAHIEDEAHTDL